MISAEKFFGGQQEVTWSGITSYCPRRKLIIATATAPGSVIGPLPKSTTYFKWKTGGFYNVVWNAGSINFTFADAEGEGLATIIPPGYCVLVAIVQVTGGNPKWFASALRRLGGHAI